MEVIELMGIEHALWVLDAREAASLTQKDL